VFLPLLPTTPFAILASILFAKTNPKMQAWLFRSKLVGGYLDNYYNKTGVTLTYKIRTFALLWIGLISSIVLIIISDRVWWLPIPLIAIGIAVSWHILSIKTKPQIDS